MSEYSTALVAAPAPTSALVMLRPIAKPTDLIAYHEEVTQLIKQALKPGVDFGEIPGTKKPSLLKAGAERINLAFGAAPVYEISEKEVDHDREVEWSKSSGKCGTSMGLYRYVVICRLMQGDRLLATGIGTCSTLESKYVDRPRDCENTVVKMAQKRAYVGATLNAYGLSDRFTQDVEDLKNPPVALHDADLDFEELKAWLRDEGVAETHWTEINRRLNGRPREDAGRVVEAVTSRVVAPTVVDAQAHEVPFAGPPATAPAAQREPAKPAGYTDSPAQQAVVLHMLKKRDVEEALWPKVRAELINKQPTSTEVDAAIARARTTS